MPTVENIALAGKILAAGGVVAIPTETVYGLAARVDRDDALDLIFRLKGRPADNPLIVHVASIEQAKALSDASAHEMLDLVGRALWPGPLTLVLPKALGVSDRITAGLETVAVRMPNHLVALALIQACESPLAAPSANRSGRPSPTSAQHVEDDLGQEVMILDGGSCEIGIESTVVRLTADSCIMLRSGAVNREILARVTGLPVIEAENGHDLKASPGTRYRHYAPRAPIVMISSVDHLALLASTAVERTMILARPELLESLTRVFPEAVAGSLTEHDLYSELRRADDLEVTSIVVLCDSIVRSHEALIDRLRKAAGT